MTARATTTVAIGVLTVASVLGAAAGLPTADADTPQRQSSSEVVAVDALTTGSAELAADRLPAGFRDMFYAPSVEDGVLVDPDGDCSSPIPLPAEFDTACKAHDLGYDVVRFGAATGEPTSTSARRELDATLRRSMHDSCRTREHIGSRSFCYVMSDVAGTAVDFNSWRQGYGTPAPEPALPFLLAGAACMIVAAAAVTAVPAVTRRRRSGGAL